MFIIIPGAFNAQVGVPGGGQQGQVVTVGSILRVIERDRRPYPTDVGTPSDIWIDNTSGIGYICKEFDTGHGTVWDRLDLLGDFVTFGDSDPGVNIDIKLGYRPGSLRYARNSEILWICKDNTQGAAVWDVLSSGGSVVSVNGLTGVVQLYLDDILDVNAPLPNDGDVLTWDSATSTWIAAIGGGGTYTVDNGLTELPANNFQLGGSTLGTGNLIRDTYITNDGYLFRIDQTGGSTSALYLRHSGTTLNSGTGLTTVTGGIGVRSSSSESYAFEGISSIEYTQQLLRNATSNNDVVGLLRLDRRTSGVPLGGIGGSIDFWIEERQTIPVPIPTDPTVRLVGLWKNPGPAVLDRLSKFDMYGYSNGGALLNASVRGDGKFTLYQYGQTPATFLGTPVWSLGVNAAGDVIEFDGSGNTYTVNNGLSPQSGSPNNFQLGGPLVKNTTITESTYNLLFTATNKESLYLNSEYTTNNDLKPILKLYRSVPVGTDGANDIGGSIEFKSSPAPGFVNQPLKTDLILASVVTNSDPQLNRETQFETWVNYQNSLIKVITASRNLTRIDGRITELGATTHTDIQSQFILSSYGSGTYTGGTLAYTLGVDASGNVIEFDAGSGGGLEYAIASGTNAYAVTIAGVTAYTDGDIYSIKFTNGNTGTSSININGLGIQRLTKSVSTNLASGDIISGQVLIIQYDGTDFQVIGIAGGTGNLPAGGTAGQILTKIDATNYNATWQDNYADWTSVVKHIVKNNGASGTITKGTAVYVTSSNGTNMLVGRASNTSEATSSKTMGLMQSDITTTGGTQTGFVITEGLLANLNTAGTTAGDPVWLGVNGALIYGLTNKPYAPDHLVFIGIVTKVSAGNGEIFVKVQNGFELKELHDVQAQSPALKDTLYFDNTVTPSQWKTAQASTLLPTSFSKGSVGVVFDGADGVITANTVAYVQVPYNGTITAWTIVSKPTAVGTCTVTAFKLSSYPPTTPTNNIFNTQPALTGTSFNQDLTPDFVSGQDVVTAGDWIGFRITLPVTVTWVNLTLSITKT